ncbi:MAG: hypothetical protein AB7I27_07300 [Bacteriovoracaceae bacterium]
MKFYLFVLMLFSFSSFAQEVNQKLSNYDNKIYSLKTKGVKDFVVEVESDRLTKQVNDQLIFGKVSKLIFKIFWTAQPERLAIDIIGLPEGFKEIKDELKLNIMGQLEFLNPVPLSQKFAGYSFTKGNLPNEILAEDKSGIAPIPAYILKFDDEQKLTEIEGKKPIGTFQVQMGYEKQGFAENKFLLSNVTSTNSENGQNLVIKKELNYSTHDGMGVLTEVEINTTQRWEKSELKPVSQKEIIVFKNYKINSGDGIKHFLAQPEKKK